MMKVCGLFVDRVKGEASGLLNLLTAFQKRHVVEFLPYHECDAPSNSSTDLACLQRLQAQHTQHRHVIFLTGKNAHNRDVKRTHLIAMYQVELLQYFITCHKCSEYLQFVNVTIPPMITWVENRESIRN